MDEDDSWSALRVVEEVVGGAVAGASGSVVGEESSGCWEGASWVVTGPVEVGESVGEDGVGASPAAVVCVTETGSGSAEHAAKNSAATNQTAVLLIDPNLFKHSPLWELYES